MAACAPSCARTLCSLASGMRCTNESFSRAGLTSSPSSPPTEPRQEDAGQGAYGRQGRERRLGKRAAGGRPAAHVGPGAGAGARGLAPGAGGGAWGRGAGGGAGVLGLGAAGGGWGGEVGEEVGDGLDHLAALGLGVGVGVGEHGAGAGAGAGSRRQAQAQAEAWRPGGSSFSSGGSASGGLVAGEGVYGLGFGKVLSFGGGASSALPELA